MRFCLAAVLICALGAPAASALPALGSAAGLAAPGESVTLVARRKPAARAARNKAKDNGIHPLVGSGGY